MNSNQGVPSGVPDPGTTSNTSETLTYPKPPTPNHNSLSSFLEYAKRSGLNPKSTVYVGTHYEYFVAESLASFGFSLFRVGGASDYGIDLLGTWAVPSVPKPIKVILQCKAMASKLGPSHVRELEGAFVGAPAGWRDSGVLGLLVGQHPATKGVRDSLGRSRWPMGYISCSVADRQVSQIQWNRHAVNHGLDGMGVAVKYTEDGSPRLTLTMHGLPLPSGQFPRTESK
ncbi:hypothetical protein PpBr36_01302 [Pyricularia pennisetigena]|uniref:hypothetical protein n=1 Tax=Pyricularia pennisetigena TaxID=1578925 RepID=UPI001153DF11|nr:hypothetical protein PpBr36_01302 [Pyricularia pennisetigena]TLS29375.1 hypothetical protein PpBr36_01302 [Pyricularia pennisetigena]